MEIRKAKKEAKLAESRERLGIRAGSGPERNQDQDPANAAIDL